MICRICNTELSINNFYIRPSGKHRSECKKCYMAHRYELAKIKADNRKKDFVMRLGGQCSKCGYCKNYAALSFHHLRDKEFNLDIPNLGTYSTKRVEAELAKCILLCANCHMELHYPHLTMEDSGR